MDVPDATHFAEPGAAIAPLKVMTETTPTRFFNDSCAESELRYAIERGATGATTNPIICMNVLKLEAQRWLPFAADLFRTDPKLHERDLAWRLYTEMGASAARLLLPVFAANDQTWGRLSIQTDPTLHHDAARMLHQSVALSGIGPNIQVKMPATSAGLAMVEEATFLGVNVNVTGEPLGTAGHRHRRGSRARADPTRNAPGSKRFIWHRVATNDDRTP